MALALVSIGLIATILVATAAKQRGLCQIDSNGYDCNDFPSHPSPPFIRLTSAKAIALPMPKLPLLERLRVKKAMQSGPVAVGWYTPDEWARVKAAAADPDVFENSFREWEAMAAGALRDLRNVGTIPIKVLISADELQAWCLDNGKPVRADARAQFVLEKARGGPGAEA